MATRTVVLEGDEVLRKKCKTVEKIDERICMILDDMAETMYAHQGLGLAAPQVGILKKMVVIDIGDGNLIELINPEIIEAFGSIKEDEGCLSLPGLYGVVERPQKVKVKALNRQGEEVFYEGEDLLAKAFCHEIDHLSGILFTDIAENITSENEKR